MNTYRATVQQLSTAQKTSKGAPAYSRFVNRKAGRYMAAAAYRLGRTPNQVTAVSAAFSALAIALVASVRPSVALGVVVAVFLAVGYAFDSADGQLARLRGGGSPAGEWLDHVVDSAKICALHLAVLVSFYRFDGRSDPELAVPLLWTFVATVSFFVIILNDQIRRAHGTAAPVTAHASVLRSLLVAPTDYGVLLLSFLLFGWHRVFVAVYAALLLANAAFLALALVKWYREIAALPKAA